MSREERLAVELFRLRYTLREAADAGRGGPEVDRALARLSEIAGAHNRGDLLFEVRRWRAHLACASRAA